MSSLSNSARQLLSVIVNEGYIDIETSFERWVRFTHPDKAQRAPGAKTVVAIDCPELVELEDAGLVTVNIPFSIMATESGYKMVRMMKQG